jgi:DNA-binding MarR family transcriptional regulator
MAPDYTVRLPDYFVNWPYEYDVGMVGRPAPLLRLLGLAERRLAVQMLAAQHDAGFDDIRPAHSAVFANVPPEGIRLTDLARRAGMTKQAMGELVSDLERLRYLVRRPDPTDGRSLLIQFSDRGWASVRLGLDTLDAMEASIALDIGARGLADLRRVLERLASDREQ